MFIFGLVFGLHFVVLINNSWIYARRLKLAVLMRPYALPGPNYVSSVNCAQGKCALPTMLSLQSVPNSSIHLPFGPCRPWPGSYRRKERNLLNKVGDEIFTQQAGEGPHKTLPWQIGEEDC